MTTTTSTALSTTSNTAVTAGSAAASLGATSAKETSDRFLKLLVAQMKNQDPLSPMDNAQVTAQMAQINTVSGINQLNETVAGLTNQFSQLQALQSASLVGHAVLVEGNSLPFADGQGQGAFEIAGAADAVKVEVLSSAGRVLDTINLGAETTGKHVFTWQPTTVPTSTSGLTFRVTATSGTAAVGTTHLVEDEVLAVSANGSSVDLELKNSGTLPYSKVKMIS